MNTTTDSIDVGSKPTSEGSDPEDILSTSLQTLYEYQPITRSSAGLHFTYTSKISLPSQTPLEITLRTPDTQASNWSLHASSIWVASIYLADYLEDVHIDHHYKNCSLGERVRILELGAAAGLPGILVAKTYGNVLVTVSDYPDDKLMQTLSENVQHNGVSSRCRAVPYAWGSDVSSLTRGSDSFAPSGDAGFHVILAADTLWNPELHPLFIDTLRMTLKRSLDARVHLVAGLHTGRYTLQSFLDAVQRAGFEIEDLEEREVQGNTRQEWSVSRAEHEDEGERRRWVLWISLKWNLNP